MLQAVTLDVPKDVVQNFVVVALQNFDLLAGGDVKTSELAVMLYLIYKQIEISWFV